MLRIKRFLKLVIQYLQGLIRISTVAEEHLSGFQREVEFRLKKNELMSKEDKGEDK